MITMNKHTVEGWNKHAEAINRSAFTNEFGREPVNKAEVTAWMNGMLAEADALYPICNEKPEQTPGLLDGEKYWVTRFY